MELLGERDRPVAGPYRLVTELGRGGMGRVLLGVTPDGRLVAVKVVSPQFVEDDGFRLRFRREVEASRKVSGAYTAAVVGADADAPLPWLASVFVPGPALSDVVRRTGPLPAEAATRLAAGLAAALGEIHRAGLVHRDLKPSNVLLAGDGPRVIDFGIARATDSEGGTAITRTGWLVGSPAFMSPEQAEGHPLTPASDVFSLGAVLVHACTGRVPFAGSSTPQTLYQVVHAAPDLTGVPDELGELAGRCLAKDPTQRPTPTGVLQSLGQLAPTVRPWPEAVHALIDEQHAEIIRVLGLSDEGGPHVELGTATAIGTAAGQFGAAPAVGTPTESVGTAHPPGAPHPAPPSCAPGMTADLPTETALANGAPAADRSAPPAGTGTTEPPGQPGSRHPTRRRLLLGALGATAAAAVAVPLGLDLLAGSGDAPDVDAAGASTPPGAAPSEAATSGAPRSPSPHVSRTPALAVSEEWDTLLTTAKISPDGRTIAAGDLYGNVVLRHVPTLEPLDSLTPSRRFGTGIDHTVGELAFSPDGSLLAACDDTAVVTLWDVASHKEVARLQGDPDQKMSGEDRLKFSRDGTVLAFSAESTITLWDVASRRKTVTLVDPVRRTQPDVEGVLADVAFSHDGRTLIAGTSTGKLRYWDVTSGRLTANLVVPGGVTDLAVSPDGKVLAGSLEDEVRLWHTHSRSEIKQVLTFPQPVSSLAFSPDGRSLAVGQTGGVVRTWSTGTWNPLREFDADVEETERDSLPFALSFSGDGALLLLCLNYQLVLWKVR
ncbi:serine/threonine protein kinase [Wenjunlia vitaminophila]|uniref:Serine/threonine protein kinase n=1 Tax=Wenjunlia vitaminophila TaxID=76728 RepID=A0A0T6LZ41_WENVI|nr:protein kinase [Wenjunlia vitaminophila]KRV51241.1 serine/threonine protein kinase [Wenjunlia vitaminophila]